MPNVMVLSALALVLAQTPGGGAPAPNAGARIPAMMAEAQEAAEHEPRYASDR